MRRKWKSNGYAQPALPLTIFALIGCAILSCGCNLSPQQSQQIYQPRVLILPAKTPVQTVEGIYQPQTVETWHSAAEYRRLEQLAIDAAAALAQERNRPK